jgi:CTP-dependent riboflavin kinase
MNDEMTPSDRVKYLAMKTLDRLEDKFSSLSSTELPSALLDLQKLFLLLRLEKSVNLIGEAVSGLGEGVMEALEPYLEQLPELLNQLTGGLQNEAVPGEAELQKMFAKMLTGIEED